MNDRIKKLEPQCWEMTEYGLQFNSEKFAHLVILECCGVVDNFGKFLTNEALIKKIKKDFGVKE